MTHAPEPHPAIDPEMRRRCWDAQVEAAVNRSLTLGRNSPPLTARRISPTGISAGFISGTATDRGCASKAEDHDRLRCSPEAAPRYRRSAASSSGARCRAESVEGDLLARPRNRLGMTLFSRVKIDYESV